jgi:hypothetical protein
MRVGRIEEVGAGGEVHSVFDQNPPHTIDWPNPEVIQNELPPVQRFSEDLLPVCFRPLVRDVAERMQVPMDYPAAVMMLCLAGAVNRRATIQPKANDTGWVVVPNLWGGIIAPPGFMKSPVIQSVTRPLNCIQSEWRLAHEHALEVHKLEKEKCDLRLAGWKENYKASSKAGKEAPERPDDAPEPPKLRRLIVNDSTSEALHQTMSENPAGVFVIRDELTGWWSMLDRPGREGERAFSLQAWNGDTGHTIDRIGRGTIHVEACCMSMAGGIQPARLRSYLVEAIEDGPGNDGLMQRFQVLVWPDTEPEWRYVDRPPNAEVEERVTRVFRRLVALNEQDPKAYQNGCRAAWHGIQARNELRLDCLREALWSRSFLGRLVVLAPAAGIPTGKSQMRFERTAKGIMNRLSVAATAGLLFTRVASHARIVSQSAEIRRCTFCFVVVPSSRLSNCAESVKVPEFTSHLNFLNVECTVMEKKRNHVTRKMVNDALRARGRDESLREGDGYFYFGGGEAVHWLSSSVVMRRISDLTLEEWRNWHTRMT